MASDMTGIKTRELKDGRKAYDVKYREPDGTQRKQTFYKVKEALSFRDEVRNSLNKGTHVPIKGKIKFKEVCDLWLKTVEVKERTRISYEGHIKLHLKPYFGEYKMQSITEEMITDFKAHLLDKPFKRSKKESATSKKLSPKTAHNIMTTLKSIFKYAARKHYVGIDPSKEVKKPQLDDKEMQFMTKEQVNGFLKHVSPEYYTLFLTAILTGVRKGELLALTWDDINLKKGAIRINKTLYKGKFHKPKTKNSRRSIEISPILVNALEIHRTKQAVDLEKNDLNLVFTRDDKGNLIDPDSLVKTQFLPTLRIAEIPNMRFHDLRHTCVALLIVAGVQPKVIQMQLGHSSIQVTMDRYGHLMPDTQSDAALRLQNLVFSADSNMVTV